MHLQSKVLASQSLIRSLTSKFAFCLSVVETAAIALSDDRLKINTYEIAAIVSTTRKTKMNTTTTIPVSSRCGKKREDIPSGCFHISRDASVSLLNHKAVSERHPELVPKWREAEKLILSWRNGAAISARPAFDKKNAGWKPDISATSKWEVGGELASYILAMRKRRDAEILACSCGEAIRLIEIQGKDTAFLSALLGMKGNAKEGVPHPTAEDFASILIGLPEISVKDCATRYRPQWAIGSGWTLKPVDVKTLPKMEPTRPLRKEGRGKVEEAKAG